MVRIIIHRLIEINVRSRAYVVGMKLKSRTQISYIKKVPFALLHSCFLLRIDVLSPSRSALPLAIPARDSDHGSCRAGDECSVQTAVDDTW